MSNKVLFAEKTGFCYICGSIFPPLKQTGCFSCYSCKREYDANGLDEEELEYTIYFNSHELDKKVNAKMETTEAHGPLVERKCTKCGHDKMSYATLQLRSADEGQTVFFTCIKCKYKESENS